MKFVTFEKLFVKTDGKYKMNNFVGNQMVK